MFNLDDGTLLTHRHARAQRCDDRRKPGAGAAAAPGIRPGDCADGRGRNRRIRGADGFKQRPLCQVLSFGSGTEPSDHVVAGASVKYMGPFQKYHFRVVQVKYSLSAF